MEAVSDNITIIPTPNAVLIMTNDYGQALPFNLLRGRWLWRRESGIPAPHRINLRISNKRGKEGALHRQNG